MTPLHQAFAITALAPTFTANQIPLADESYSPVVTTNARDGNITHSYILALLYHERKLLVKELRILVHRLLQVLQITLQHLEFEVV